MSIARNPLEYTSIYDRIEQGSDESDDEGGMGNVSRAIMRPPGHSGKAKRGHLCFDASFECGNLGRVDLINEHEYDLFIRPDTCNPRFRFWFNFTVDNVKQDQKVIFNIVNISKSYNLFADKLTPIVKSSSRPKWQRIPKEFVFYHRSPVHSNHYILSIAFSFDKEDEVFQFALAPPYSYSRLQTYLQVLENKMSNRNYFSRDLLGKSVQTRRLDLLTVGPKGPGFTKKRVVAIIARIHPGETPSSFVCQGLLDLLISSHPVACILREHIIFKIVPMMNPDGVFLGNYRSTLMGFDLNRSWHIASPWAHPTLKAVIDMLLAIDKSKEFQLDFVIDIHAHPSLRGCFIYGNAYEDVYRYERHIIFPKLLAAHVVGYSAENAMFNADARKDGTARRYFCSALSDSVNCYTFQVSIYGYQTPNSETILPFTEESYMRCGRNLAQCILEYYHVTGEIATSIFNKIDPKLKRSKTHKPRSRTRKRETVRTKSARRCAIVHHTDINDCYSSSFNDESPTFRSINPMQFDKVKDQHNASSSRQRNRETVPLGAPTLIYTDSPRLSIIDFNKIVYESIGRLKIK